MYSIVYKSNTGFTKEYAELLSNILKLKCFSVEEVKDNLKNGSEIIFFSPITAQTIEKLRFARKYYKVKAICAVGINIPSKENEMELRERNEIPKKTMFYLQGGINKEKLKGFKKLIIKIIAKVANRKIEKSKTGKITVEEIKLARVLKDNGSYVSEKNLKPIIEWYNGMLDI